MRLEKEHLVSDSAEALAKFGQFIGGFENLVLQNDILDEKKNALVKADIPLREGLLNAMANRKENHVYRIKNNQSLADACSFVIHKEVEKITHLKEFAFGGFLLRSSNLDMLRLIKTALSNLLIRNTFILWMFEGKSIVPHLLETAVISSGLVAELRKEKYTMKELTLMFRAGLMHDYALADKSSWETEDIFREHENPHARDSASALAGLGMEQELLDVISSSHAIGNRYQYVNNLGEIDNLPLAILCLTEYYLYLTRAIKVPNTTKPDLPKIMYELSFAGQKGFLPKVVIAVFEKFFSDYQKFFRYGEKVAAVEQKCIHKDLAIAYPKPRSTQMICSKPGIECRHSVHQQPVKIVESENDIYNRFNNPIRPGWYSKCEFSHELPKPITDL